MLSNARCVVQQRRRKMHRGCRKIENDAVARMRKRAKHEHALSYEKQVTMLDRIFKALVPYVLEGYIIKPKQNIGEFMLGQMENYTFCDKHKVDWVKTMKDPDGECHKKSFTPVAYFLFWKPSERKELMGYWFLSDEYFNHKLNERLNQKGPLFAYEKDYYGLIPEWKKRRNFA